MTIEAILQSIDTKLGTLIQLANTPAPIVPQQPSSDSFVAGAGADPEVARRVNEAIASAGGVAGETSATPATKRGRGRPAKQQETAAATPTPAATPAAAQPDPFAVEQPAAAPETPRTLNDVRAALVVYQNKNTQAEAIKLMKDTSGKETLAQLTTDDYSKLFKAAIPSNEFDLADVRLVLVRANERVANSGLEVLKKFGVTAIVDLPKDKFTDVIIAAHSVK